MFWTISKKVIITLALLLALSMFCTPVKATGNEWVYDEPQVISQESEDYIKALNEEVFATYAIKPQMGIMIVNDLPDGYTMDEYKLELFNLYGVGTAEENCGMLFVFALNDRKYGFEIGDGFKKGTFLRADLEKDFITEDMKDLLRAGDYDEVIMQIVYHLEQIMSDEENGVYALKEEVYLEYMQEQQAQREADRKRRTEQFTEVMYNIFIIAIALILVVCAFLIIQEFYRKKVISKLVTANHRYVKLLGESEDSVVKYFITVVKGDILSLSELKHNFIKHLHSLYIELSMLQIKQEERFCLPSQYEQHLTATNDLEAFQACNLIDIDTIIYQVDQEMKHILDIKEQNKARIQNYIERNSSRIEKDTISLSKLAEKIRSHCKSGELLSDSDLEEYFVEELNELNFRYAYDKFIEENESNMDRRYFDSSQLYNTLRKSPEYAQYQNRASCNSTWMYLYLHNHMENQRREAKRRESERLARQEAARKAQQSSSSYSSFGGSFGGGHSSGGGFSGGW